MAKGADSLSKVIEEMETEGLANEPVETRFVQAVMRVMPDSPAKREKALIASSGLERLLLRHHRDSKLIVSASVALGENSEYAVPDFVKKLGRFLRFLEAPVASHSIKNIKLANVVSSHPEILQIKNIDSITALGRLPEGVIEKGSTENEIVIGDTTIKVDEVDLKEINRAVKKAKSEITPKKPRAEKPKAVEVKSDEESVDREDDDADFNEESSPYREPLARGDSLPSDFSEAASALGKILGRLSHDDAHAELSQALEEARKLLLKAMSVDAPVARGEAGADTQADFH